MPGQTVPEVAGLQLDQPAKASPAAGLTAAVRPDDLAMPRERPAGSPSQHPASLKALSDIKPPETERPLAGRQAIGPPQAAPPANALETDRPAPVNGHAQRSPFAGQTATPASTAADASWTGTAPIRNEPAVLRLEHPFWAAAGSGEPVANEARLILPTDAPPPATREMRLLGDIIEKAYWHQENGRAQARIQIKPDFLGHLQLDVQTHQSKVSVEIRVETLLAREFIETNLQGLKTNLQESGLDIDRIDVIVDSGGDNPRDQHREPARKHGRQPGTLAEMTENTRPGNHENPNRLLSTGGAQNSINTFA